MKQIYIALICGIMTVVVACTNNDQFRVNGIIEGKPTINLRIGYYADGAYRTQITAAREGEFEFFGSSRQPVIVDIYDYEYRLIGRVVAANGQTLDVRLRQDDPYAIEASGNDVSHQWAQFLQSNADKLRAGTDSANAVVARYIAGHPGDILSTILLTTAYDSGVDPEMADSLLSLIEPAARPSYLTEGFNYLLQGGLAQIASDTIQPFRYINPRGDTATFSPAKKGLTLIAFWQKTDRIRTDSIEPLLRRVALPRHHTTVVDLSLNPDNGEWRRWVSADTSAWVRAWTPGGLMSRVAREAAVYELPFYIVCDSTGHQLLRTPSAAAVGHFIK